VDIPLLVTGHYNALCTDHPQTDFRYSGSKVKGLMKSEFSHCRVDTNSESGPSEAIRHSQHNFSLYGVERRHEMRSLKCRNICISENKTVGLQHPQKKPEMASQTLAWHLVKDIYLRATQQHLRRVSPLSIPVPS
jgi:hypothetical protein